jgi:hypothetical protein
MAPTAWARRTVHDAQTRSGFTDRLASSRGLSQHLLREEQAGIREPDGAHSPGGTLPAFANEAAGLLASSTRRSLKPADDHGMLSRGMTICDTLYAACGGIPLTKLVALAGLK